MHPVGFGAYWAPSSRVGPLAVVRVLLPSGAPLASTLGHLGLPFIVIARAIALTIPCLPHSLADEKRVGSLDRPDMGARFPTLAIRRRYPHYDRRAASPTAELAAERRQWLGLCVRERRRRRIWRTACQSAVNSATTRRIFAAAVHLRHAVHVGDHLRAH
jgi:hypothetical protein